MYSARSSCAKEQGNVLFLILIAVALFAALSYAVTSSTRSSGTGVSKDKARANAAAIIQYTSSIKTAVDRLRISAGCNETTLDFRNPIYMRNNGSLVMLPNVTAPPQCRLFSSDGGNMIPIVQGLDSLDLESASITNPTAVKIGHASLQVMQIKGVGTDAAVGVTSANDLVFRIDGLNNDTCLAINDILGIDNPGGILPESINTGPTVGTYTNGSLSGNFIKEGPEINGKATFCYGAVPVYMHVLLER